MRWKDGVKSPDLLAPGDLSPSPPVDMGELSAFIPYIPGNGVLQRGKVLADGCGQIFLPSQGIALAVSTLACY